MKRFIALACILPLAACSTLYPTPQVKLEHLPVVDLPMTPPQGATNGAIFQAASYRPLFEDNRARMVGDTLTVQITENISATQNATSTIDKKGSAVGAVTAVPGLNAAKTLANAGINGSSEFKHDGTGGNTNTNTFSGSITAVVIAVLPNGHLMITGEKQIGVNQNVDVLRFSGQVDPRSIGQGNVVASTLIANVRIEQRGRGAFADAQGIGWLSRFFLNLSPT
ncbi:MAG: flagellar basal body L-ring protein FlgH [Paucibacter sp.]|nr:flagellar basal body L-ring protein FlgH [Roseateles sp.]